MFTAKDALYQSMAYTDKKTNDIPKTSTLEDLTDVNITTPSDGEVLKYDAESEKWVNGSRGSSQEDYEINIYTNDPGVYSIYDEITFSDIVSAYESGKRLVAFMHGEAGVGPYWYGDVKMFLTSVESWSGNGLTFNFCMTAVDRYQEGQPYVASIISIKECGDDTPVVIGGPEETEPGNVGVFILDDNSTWAEINTAFKAGRPIFAYGEQESLLVPLNNCYVDGNGDLTSLYFQYSWIAIDSTDYLQITEFTIYPAYSGDGWRYDADGFYTRYIPTYADPPES